MKMHHTHSNIRVQNISYNEGGDTMIQSTTFAINYASKLYGKNSTLAEVIEFLRHIYDDENNEKRIKIDVTVFDE